MKEAVLGVDIGGVIIDRTNDKTDTSFFGGNYLRTTAVPDAFAVIGELTRRRFGSVYLVSKCGERTEVRTLEWLRHHEFCQQAGVPLENVRFCRERQEKAGICKELGITHFIDDRLEVLGYLTSVETLLLFQPRPDEVRRFIHHLHRVHKVDSWQHVREVLLS